MPASDTVEFLEEEKRTVSGTAQCQDSKKDRIKVVIRLRPVTSKKEKRSIVVLDEKTVLLEEKGNFNGKVFTDFKQRKSNEGNQFIFDAVFGEDASQEEVYNVTAKCLVNEMIAGDNGMIFAYGATGSGKTYTMMAINYSTNNSIEYSRSGIITQTFRDLFTAIKEHHGRYIVTLSYMEIYNETIRDLFNNDGSYLELRGNGDVQISGLKELVTTSCHQAINLLKKGNEIRSVRFTGANSVSSRSHAILIIILRQTIEYQPTARQSKLLFVDLAGSERAKYTKNKGKRLQEGGHINKSLLALGNCISALSHGTKAFHINFRDSKLTRLLREPLSGNYRTVMIAQVNPTTEFKEDIKNTLIFASKAMGITKRIKPSSIYSGNQVPRYQNLIGELHDEVTRLRNKIKKQGQESRVVSENYNKARKLRDDMISVFEERIKLRQELMEIDNHLISLRSEAEKQHHIISHWQSKSGKLYYWRNSPNYESDESSNTAVDKHINEATLALSSIEKEQEESFKYKNILIEKLEQMKENAINLENELANLDEDTEKEFLKLFCRVHELEAEKLRLEGARMIDAHESHHLRDFIIQYQDQQKISDNIITKQRQLIEENKIHVPVDLQTLYQLYQEEIHITALRNFKYENDTERLIFPALIKTEKEVFTPNLKSKQKNFNSSSNSQDNIVERDNETLARLPKISSSSMSDNNVRSSNPSPIPATVLFPPIIY